MEFTKFYPGSLIKINAESAKDAVFKPNYHPDDVSEHTPGDLYNKDIKKIIEISRNVVHSDIFYLVLAGGYAINSFNNQRWYAGDVDLWICAKKIVADIKKKADEYIDAILAKIYDLAGQSCDALDFRKNPTKQVNLSYGKIIQKKKTTRQYSLQKCVKSINAVTLVLNNIKTYNKTYQTLSMSRTEFQFILRIYNKPEEIIDSFDLDCCKIAYVFNDDLSKPGYYLTNSTVIDCIVNKKNYFNPNIVDNSYYNRMVKYFRKGYSIVFKNFNYNLLAESGNFKIKIGRLMLHWRKRTDNVIKCNKIAIVSNDNVVVKPITTGESFQIDEESVIINNDGTKSLTERNFVVSNYPMLNIVNIADEMRTPTDQEIERVAKIYLNGYYSDLRGIKLIDMLDKSDAKLMYEFISKKYRGIKNVCWSEPVEVKNKANKKADKFMEVIAKRITDIQKIYYSIRSTETINNFNLATNTPEKRWRFIDEIVKNYQTIDLQDLYKEYYIDN